MTRKSKHKCPVCKQYALFERNDKRACKKCRNKKPKKQGVKMEFEGIICTLGLKSIRIKLDDEEDYKKLRIGKCMISQE